VCLPLSCLHRVILPRVLKVNLPQTEVVVPLEGPVKTAMDVLTLALIWGLKDAWPTIVPYHPRLLRFMR
jgi:hypothetical protein